MTHNPIQAISRDRLCYIWAGNNYGLTRLEGYQISNFIFYPENPSSISSSFIKSLFVDSQNELWVGTIGGGLNKFDRNTSGFIHFLLSNLPNTIRGLNISAITKDHS